jgi:hypothetical protein
MTAQLNMSGINQAHRSANIHALIHKMEFLFFNKMCESFSVSISVLGMAAVHQTGRLKPPSSFHGFS